VLKTLVLPLLHLWIRAQGGVNRFRQREKLNAAVYALRIFTEHDLINRDIRAAWVCDLVTAIIQRIARLILTRPHVRVEVEQLSQPYDWREIAQCFSFEFRTQFLFRFVL